MSIRQFSKIQSITITTTPKCGSQAKPFEVIECLREGSFLNGIYFYLSEFIHIRGRFEYKPTWLKIIYQITCLLCFTSVEIDIYS